MSYQLGGPDDAPATNATGQWRITSLIKGMFQSLINIAASVAGTLNVSGTITTTPPTGSSSTTVQGTIAHDGVDANNPIKIGGYAKDTAPSNVSADADRTNAWFRRNGALATFPAYGLNALDDAVANYPPGTQTRVGSTAMEASRIIKASAGTLFTLLGYSTIAQYIHIFDSATVPGNATAPTLPPIKVAADSNFSISLPLNGIPFTAGIAVSNSTTLATKTLGAADCWFTAVIL